jgi:hypothetical protein
MVKCSVFFVVRTGFLYVIYMSFSFKGLIKLIGDMNFLMTGNLTKKVSIIHVREWCSGGGENCIMRSFIIRKKVKLSHYTPWRHMGGGRYSSNSFLTSALDEGEWSASRPGRALTPGKGPPVLIVQEAGWAPEPVWTQRLQEKSSASFGDRTPGVQSVVRHYTDWATPAPFIIRISHKYCAAQMKSGAWTHIKETRNLYIILVGTP